MLAPTVRRTNDNGKISREEFKKRFDLRFRDPWFDKHRQEISELEAIAWKAYLEGHKAPKTLKAGEGYADPTYDLSLDWVNTKDAIDKAQKKFEDPESPNHVLVICASDRNEQTCPSEVSKSYRLTKMAIDSLKQNGMEVELLDLSKITSEFGKMIYPCKGCVSTAMPLCHWPCSCYPNHSLGQEHDWMNEIYPMWVRAHGIMIITPVYWHQAPSVLKLMIDRLVCADGGNPDPTSTKGKKAEIAKEMELKGWDYPRHLSGRLFSLIIHGDTMGVDDLKNSLTSWLTEMMLIPSSIYGSIARYVGYYGPYATSHDELDKDEALQNEVKIAAEALALNVKALREKKLSSQVPELADPRPK